MEEHTLLAEPAIVTDQKWPEGTRPLVSILCVTYNHERFIDDCLRGFLMQKTSFPVEIIVHDDASTDGTQHIVRRYCDEYPNLFRPVFQDQNQYSLGRKPSLLALQHARGEYVALCDGDDYWTNAQKLERQVAVFNDDPDVTICFHAAQELDMASGKTTVIGNPMQKDTVIVSLKRVILGRGAYMPTSSIMFKNPGVEDLARVLEGMPIGDFFIQVYMAARGKCVFYNSCACIYRRNVTASWTWQQTAAESKALFARQMLNSIDRFYPFVKGSDGSSALHSVFLFYLRRSFRDNVGWTARLAEQTNSIMKVKNLIKGRLLGGMWFDESARAFRKLGASVSGR